MTIDREDPDVRTFFKVVGWSIFLALLALAALVELARPEGS